MPVKAQLTTLPVAALEVCDRTRVRQQKPKDGSDVVIEYAEAYQCGLIVEPLDVFREKGTERYIVADGEHRLLGLRRAKIDKVECRLHEGDELDALRFAAGCNQKHGLRRSKDDIYHTLCRIMETPLRDEFRTDTQLSELLGISIRTVQSYRARWRDSDGGGARVRAKKQAARQSAEKHTSFSKGNLQVAGSQVAEATRKSSAPAHTGASSTPSAPKSGESESGLARSDSRHSQQPPRVSVDDSRKDGHPESTGKAPPHEGKRQSSAQRLGDSAPTQMDTSAQRVKGAVMNPPESAAQGSEAGNRNTPVGVDAGQVRPPAPGPALGARAALAVEFLHAIGVVPMLPSAAEARVALNGKIDWTQVERAHQWLTELLAER